jgi:hypothetical protein
MTGENSFIRLSHDGGATLAARLSHWRVLWCPSGAGHVLFVQSELTGDTPRIYSDNAAVARWLQRTIETYLFPAFAEPGLPIHTASFSRSGGPGSSATEIIEGATDRIVMTWYDFLASFVLTMPPGTPPERPIGVFSTFFPAQGAQVEVNGTALGGSAWLEMRGDRQSSSACLALSETWVTPRAT